MRYRVNYHQDSSSASSSSALSETESEAVGFKNDWRPLQSRPCEQASSDRYSFSVSQFDLEATFVQLHCKLTVCRILSLKFQFMNRRIV